MIKSLPRRCNRTDGLCPTFRGNNLISVCLAKKVASDSISFDQGFTTNSKIYDFRTGALLDGPALLALFGAECHSLTLNHMSCRRVNLVSRASLEAWFPVGLAQHGRDLQAQPLPHALRTKLCDSDSDVCHYWLGCH